ncbi:MAG TPA: Rieske (2Fe-2S) protein [Reyranella sp.]|nr:Rieske (2Fe-2S) protein [Reyranella sp.]
MGVVNIKSSQSREHRTMNEAGYHRCWYPVCLASDLETGALVGRDILGTRVVVYRDPAGKPVVQSAWCPHLGADLSVGQIVEGKVRCPYHHWSFGADGACTHIPAGDKIPSAAKIFTYPAAEAWGLIWAFNGETADVPVPRIPGATEDTIVFEAAAREPRPFDGWVAVSNGVDFQHLRTLHGLPNAVIPDEIAVDAGGIEFRMENAFYLQHGRISGTSVFAQHLRLGGKDTYMLFCGAPIEPGWTSGLSVAGVPKGEEARLPEVRAWMEKLNEEDQPVLRSMRFRRGLLTASDRHLGRYFKYVEEFPTFLPPA